MSLRSVLRQPLALVAVGAIGAVLAPVAVNAARGGGGTVRIKDADSRTKAQVDRGKLRVGDGSGPINVGGTVNVAVPGTGTRVLAQGDCDINDSYGNTATIASGRTVTGIVLTVDSLNAIVNKLVVTAPSSSTNSPSGNLFVLTVGNTEKAQQDQLDFGVGIKLSESWSLSCVLGEGDWIVYGY